MPPTHPEPGSSPPAAEPPRPPRRPSGWVIATDDLYIGGGPGTGAMAVLAHRAGDRLTAAAAERNGWTAVRPD